MSKIARVLFVRCFTKGRPFERLFYPNLNINRHIFSNVSSQNFRMSIASKKPKTDSVKIGTHSGNFHCDEVLACFMLQQLEKYKNAEIIRTRDMEILNTCDIVVDVGSVFDREANRFDHHQKTFNETLSSLRPELGPDYGIRLSSAGLIFTYFGEDVIDAVLKAQKNSISLPPKSISVIFRKVYENLIQEIDAIDNGVQICEGEPRYQITTHLSNRVGHFNPPWNNQGELDETMQFEKAKTYVGGEFIDKVLFYATSWLPVRDIVAEALDNAGKVHKSQEIIELKTPCPWKEHLQDLEVERDIVGQTKYVLFVDKPGDWRVMCVPRTPKSFICRKFLHKDWRGLRNNQITELSGIDDANFCHATGFIGGAKSRVGVLAMAVQSLNGDYDD